MFLLDICTCMQNSCFAFVKPICTFVRGNMEYRTSWENNNVAHGFSLQATCLLFELWIWEHWDVCVYVGMRICVRGGAFVCVCGRATGFVHNRWWHLPGCFHTSLLPVCPAAVRQLLILHTCLLMLFCIPMHEQLYINYTNLSLRFLNYPCNMWQLWFCVFAFERGLPCICWL